MGYCLFVEWSADLISSPSIFVSCEHFIAKSYCFITLAMTERVYKIALLGNEGVGKTGKEVSFTEFIFVLKGSKNGKFKTVFLEIGTCHCLTKIFCSHLESRFHRLLTSDSASHL